VLLGVITAGSERVCFFVNLLAATTFVNGCEINQQENIDQQLLATYPNMFVAHVLHDSPLTSDCLRKRLTDQPILRQELFGSLAGEGANEREREMSAWFYAAGTSTR
jgi:hypothetical protein